MTLTHLDCAVDLDLLVLDVKKRHKQQLEHKSILGRWWKQTSDQSASAFKAKTDQPNKAGEMCRCKLLAQNLPSRICLSNLRDTLLNTDARKTSLQTSHSFNCHCFSSAPLTQLSCQLTPLQAVSSEYAV